MSIEDMFISILISTEKEIKKKSIKIDTIVDPKS